MHVRPTGLVRGLSRRGDAIPNSSATLLAFRSHIRRET